jgi:hypothetical protein
VHEKSIVSRIAVRNARVGGGAGFRGTEPATPAVQVGRSAYHGWPDAGVLCSKQAEVVIVPAIGWIMSFGLLSPKADGGNTLPDILI